jgi:hypothetical protein
MTGSSYLCSQIIGGVENVVPLHVDIPRTGGRVLNYPLKYLQFLYEYFLLVLLPFGCYCSKLCPSYNPRRKNHKDSDQVNALAKYHC